jgi:hypothetical protein
LIVAESYFLDDPFTGERVEIHSRLTDRLRGRYANGPILPNGEPEFGWRQMPTVSIQIEAANEIERLRKIEAAARNLIDNSPTGDDDKPYCSDVAQTEFAALAATL